MKIDNEAVDLNMTFKHERAPMILQHVCIISKLLWWDSCYGAISSEHYGMSRVSNEKYGMGQAIKEFDSTNV